MSEAVGEGTSRDTGQGTYVQWKGVVKLVAKAEAVVSILVTPLSYVCVCVCVSLLALGAKTYWVLAEPVVAVFVDPARVGMD